MNPPAAPENRTSDVLHLNIEEWSLQAAALMAHKGVAWASYETICIRFGRDIDQPFYCACCCDTFTPATSSLVRLGRPSTTRTLTEIGDTMIWAQNLIAHGIISKCKKLETLTLEYVQEPNKPTYFTPQAYGLMGSWNVFEGLPTFYGPPPKEEKDDEEEYDDPYATHVPLLKSLTLINWIVAKKDLESIANSFPYLQSLKLIRPRWHKDCVEAVHQWFADRLPFMEIDDNYTLQDTFSEQKDCPHVS